MTLCFILVPIERLKFCIQNFLRGHFNFCCRALSLLCKTFALASRHKNVHWTFFFPPALRSFAALVGTQKKHLQEVLCIGADRET